MIRSQQQISIKAAKMIQHSQNLNPKQSEQAKAKQNSKSNSEDFKNGH
jgi:hypothetical protein